MHVGLVGTIATYAVQYIEKLLLAAKGTHTPKWRERDLERHAVNAAFSMVVAEVVVLTYNRVLLRSQAMRSLCGSGGGVVI